MLFFLPVVFFFYLFQHGDCELTCSTKGRGWRVRPVRRTFSNNIRGYILRVLPGNETAKASGEPDFSVVLSNDENVVSVNSPMATLLDSIDGEYFFSLNNRTRKAMRRRNHGKFNIVFIVVQSEAENASMIQTMTNGNFSCDLPKLPTPKILECRELPIICPAVTVVKTNSTHEIGKLTLNVTRLFFHNLTIGFDVPVKEIVLIEDRSSSKPWGSKLRPSREPSSSEAFPTRSPGRTLDPEQFHPMTVRPGGRTRGSGGRTGRRPRGPGGRTGGPTGGRTGGKFIRPSRRPRTSPSPGRRNKILLKANSSECDQVFTFKRRLPRKSRRNTPLQINYMITFGNVKPAITHIRYGNRFCSTSCGVKPDCEPVNIDDLPDNALLDDLTWLEQQSDELLDTLHANQPTFNALDIVDYDGEPISSDITYAGMPDSDLERY